MKHRMFFKIISLLFAMLFSFQVRAELNEESIRSFLNTSGERLIEALGMEDKFERYEVLDEMFGKNVDTFYMGRYVLGQYYRTMTDEQKSRYHELFNRYIKSLYKSYPIDFKTDELGFEILSVNVYETYANALAVINLPEKYRTENIETVTVQFRVHEKGETFQIADLEIGGVSLLIGLKKRFMQMLKDDENEIDWFLDDFEDLTKSNEKNLDL